MDFKQIVEETFYSIIFEYKLFVRCVNEKHVQLIGENCLIKIHHHMEEVFVIISKENTQIDIRPSLWASFQGKYDYKETVALRYPNDILLGQILIYNLFHEATFIRLYCKELLDGDFSKAEEYQKKSREILLEQYHYNEEKLRKNRDKH
jgi:hypothetical protein